MSVYDFSVKDNKGNDVVNIMKKESFNLLLNGSFSDSAPLGAL